MATVGANDASCPTRDDLPPWLAGERPRSPRLLAPNARSALAQHLPAGARATVSYRRDEAAGAWRAVVRYYAARAALPATFVGTAARKVDAHERAARAAWDHVCSSAARRATLLGLPQQSQQPSSPAQPSESPARPRRAGCHATPPSIGLSDVAVHASYTLSASEEDAVAGVSGSGSAARDVHAVMRALDLIARRIHPRARLWWPEMDD